MALVETKTQRANQPQLGADRDTCAANVPGILRNIGLIEHDVQQGFAGHGDTRHFRTGAIQIETLALPVCVLSIFS